LRVCLAEFFTNRTQHRTNARRLGRRETDQAFKAPCSSKASACGWSCPPSTIGSSFCMTQEPRGAASSCRRRSGVRRLV